MYPSTIAILLFVIFCLALDPVLGFLGFRVVGLWFSIILALLG
jgi:hypothetical protein